MKRYLIWIGVIAIVASSCATSEEGHGDMRVSVDRRTEVTQNPSDPLKSETQQTQFTPVVSQKQIKPGPIWTYYENTGVLRVDFSFNHEGVKYDFSLAADKSPKPGNISGESVYGNATVGSEPEYDIVDGFFTISDMDENNNRIDGSFSFSLINEENSVLSVFANFMDNDFKTSNAQ